jgi:acetyl-CoA C-acetyltransferase
MERKVAVIGVGNTVYASVKKEKRERSELARACVQSALEFVGRGLSLSDVEAVYYADVDGFEGVHRPDRSMDCFGQSMGTPVFTVNTGGTAGGSAIKSAYQMVAAGLYDIVLVYGCCTLLNTADAQQILNTATPPLIEKPIAIGAIHLAGYYLNRYQVEYGTTAEDFARVAAKNHKHAVNNQYAHNRRGYTVEQILESPVICYPVHLYEICPVSSGSCCLILASEEKARELSDTPVWFRSISTISDTYMVGYRDFLGFPLLRKLARKVYQEAGITKPLEEIDYAEVFNPFAGFEYLQYDALGFCEDGQGPRLVREGVTDLGGKLPVNLSGGTLCTNSGVAASVTRHAETCLQLMGRVEKERQVENARVGLSH